MCTFFITWKIISRLGLRKNKKTTSKNQTGFSLDSNPIHVIRWFISPLHKYPTAAKSHKLQVALNNCKYLVQLDRYLEALKY